MKVGEFHLDFNKKTYIMAIVNLTPDSFSDGGEFNQIDNALIHAEKLVKGGADILDLGGESTRPGSTLVSLDEELERVIPVIERMSREFEMPISIDTYKAEVARRAIQAGATIINDVWGGKKDPDMAKVAAETGVPIVLMHNREKAQYDSFIRDVISDLYESVHLMESAGVSKEKIILDPGFGFAKSADENLLLMRNLEKFTSLGFPVLLGTSRKSTIGKVLGDVPPNERLFGTGATVCYGIAQGCQIVRVHDVKEIAEMVKMMDAMMGK